MVDKRRIAEARAILEKVTPLDFDCGTLCGHLCCTDHEPGVGVYLIPGELDFFDGTESWATFQMHKTKDYEFAPSWNKHKKIPFLQCTSLCNREKRPFECRTYPLIPFLHDDGRLEMRYSPFAQGICPLTERYGLDQLNPAFVAATGRAWEVLMADPDMLDHIRYLTDQLKAAELPGASYDQEPE